MTVSDDLHIAIQAARAAAAAELAERTAPTEPNTDGRKDAGFNNTAPARASVLALLKAPTEILVAARVLPPRDDSATQIDEIANTSTLS